MSWFSWISFSCATIILNIIALKQFWWMIVLSFSWIIYRFYSQQRQQNPRINKWFLLLGLIVIIRIIWVFANLTEPAKVTWQRTDHWTVTVIKPNQTWNIVQDQQANYHLLALPWLQQSLITGEKLQFQGRWKKLQMQPKWSNFFWHAKSYKVQGRLYALNNRHFIRQPARTIRAKFKTWLLNQQPRQFQNWVKWLLFQNRITWPNNRFQQHLQQMGISHFFVISGFHLLIGAMIFSKLIKRIKHAKLRTICSISSILFAGWIVYLTNFKLTAIKAWLLITLTWLFRQLKQPDLIRERLNFVFVIMIGFWPLLIYRIGLQISFIASWVILANPKPNAKRFNLRQLIKQNWLISLALIPIIINLQNGISLFLLIYLLIFNLWSWLFYPVFFALIWIPQLSPFWILIFDFTTWIINSLAKINIFIHLWTWPALWKLIYYQLVFCILIVWKWKIQLWLMSILILGITIIDQFRNWQNQHYHLHMLDVGHGLAMLLRTHHNQEVVLLDAGIGKRKISQSLKIIKYLAKWNIRKLDAVFISHQHHDHMNNLAFLKTQIPITKIYDFQQPQAIYQVGNLKFYNLGAQISKTSAKNNNKSLILLTQLHQKWILFPFDIEILAETQLIQQFQPAIPISLLQVAHHGSNSSSHWEFLKFFQPEYCLISNQKPIKQIVKQRLTNFCQIFTTRKFGDLTVFINKTTIKVKKTYL